MEAVSRSRSFTAMAVKFRSLFFAGCVVPFVRYDGTEDLGFVARGEGSICVWILCEKHSARYDAEFWRGSAPKEQKSYMENNMASISGLIEIGLLFSSKDIEELFCHMREIE